MIPRPEVGFYPSRTGLEQFLRFYSNSHIQVILIEPLFEERNFLRRTVVEIARALARLDIGSFIPDLPGCGESQWDISDVRLSDWRTAVVDAVTWLARENGRVPHIAALRGGCLLDEAGKAASWWRFAPATGAELLRPLRRASQFSGNEESLAGFALQTDMIADLERAVPSEPLGLFRQCNIESTGTPLWRRAEPAEDQRLVDALAGDIGAWVHTCAAA